MLKKESPWVLRGDVVVLSDGDQLKLIAENGIKSIKPHNSDIAKLLHLLSTTGVVQELDNESEGSLIRKLKDANLIHAAPPCGMTPLQTIQWSWNEAVAPNQKISQQLKNSLIVVVGCGGTGSLVAQSLAGSGIGSFVLIDFDKVSINNLNRQFVFGVQDIGQYKADILAQRLMLNQKVVEAKSIISEITSSRQLAKLAKGADLIICCADEPKGAIQSYVANAAVQAGTSALFGAVGINNGIIGPLLKNRSSFQAYLRWIREVQSVCKKIIVPARFPSNGITNSIIANLMAWEAFQHLAKIGPSKVDACILTLNFKSFELTQKQVFK
ncbi:ThiF family adenylyltransferase [Pseudomonas veronii]|nr:MULTISPECIES: ThiF family adenylyltransferase [Pseudomonas]MDY7553495.1 ThiF family adenylyltransferase [Pseudomonas sp. FG1]MEB0054078.1 ThiF family adenylyltransferase [Pseudomonas sp. FG1]RTY62285.1 ThiF family adenylyltransferase [Pseudomonas veronii]